MGAIFTSVVLPILIKAAANGTLFELIKLVTPMMDDPAIRAAILNALMQVHSAQVGDPAMDHVTHGGH